MKNIRADNKVVLEELHRLRLEYDESSASYKHHLSKLKSSEGVLIASETRYRRLFETAKDGILILDAETGMIMDVNPFLINLLGYSKVEFIEKAIWEIGFFKDIVANQDKFLELQQQEYVRYENLPLKTADGKKINVEFVSNVYLVNSHKVIQCNIRDITERKMEESRINFSSKILSLLNTTTPFNETIDHILHSIQETFGYDALGIRVKNGYDYPYFIQNGFSDDFLSTENTLLGYTEDGMVCHDSQGKPCLECTCGLVISGKTDSANPLFTEGGSFWTNNSELLLELTGETDPRYNPRNRCIHDGYLSFALIPIHHRTEIVGLLQLNDRKKDRFTPVMIKYLENIAETIGVALMREQREKAFHKSETLYRNLIEKSHDGVYKSTHEGKFIEVNPALVKMLGYANKEELKEIDIRTQLYFEPSDRERLLARELLEEVEVYRLKRKDGSEIWVEDHGGYECGPAGNILFHEGILRDVTDRKQAEDEIRMLNETLEERIIERTEQLESINKKLEFHVNEVEQFGYITNHDLQEPLRTLVQFSNLLREEYSDKLDEDGRKYIEFINNSGLRMKELVMDLRDYALLGKDGSPKMVACSNIVDSVISDLDDSIKESHAKIAVQKLPVINCHETEIRLLFQNLVSNAIKFRKKGTIPEITISVENKGTEWLFKIEDNGIGIDKKHQDKIFIIFQRLHKRSEYEGTGIGLAHCKKIVELHGGRIWLDSSPGKGCAFMFTIPKRITQNE